MIAALMSSAATAAVAVFVMRRRYRSESLADWEQRLDDAYDLGREAGRELYWFDALMVAPAPVDALIAWNPDAKSGAEDATQVMFSHGRYDGWWEAANFDLTDTVDSICKGAA